MATIAERVAAGVAWQDEHDPGWWMLDAPRRRGAIAPGAGPIDLDELRMADPCRCVLGQRTGDYYTVRIPLDQAVACGFDTATGAAMADNPDADAVDVWAQVDAEFAELTAEWSRVITQRREAAALEGATR